MYVCLYLGEYIYLCSILCIVCVSKYIHLEAIGSVN